MNNCRKCKGSLEKKEPSRTIKPTQEFYYEYYYYCKDCNTQYLVEEAKVFIDQRKQLKAAEILLEQALKIIRRMK